MQINKKGATFEVSNTKISATIDMNVEKRINMAAK